MAKPGARPDWLRLAAPLPHIVQLLATQSQTAKCELRSAWNRATLQCSTAKIFQSPWMPFSEQPGMTTKVEQALAENLIRNAYITAFCVATLTNHNTYTSHSWDERGWRMRPGGLEMRARYILAT